MTTSDEPFLALLKDSLSQFGNRLNRAVTSFALTSVWLYEVLLSPIFGGRCRFQPTCSEYAKDCLKSQTFFIAIALIIRRLSLCHPLGRSGYDPAPPPFRSENV